MKKQKLRNGLNGTTVVRGPSRTYSNMLQLCGASLIGSWDMRDAVFDGSDNATSLPGRVGGTMALTAGTGAKKTTLNGQVGVTALNTTPVRYESGTLSAAIKSFFAVAVIPSLNSADYNVGFDVWVSGGGWNYCTIAPGTSALVNTYAGHTVNGVTTDSLTAGQLCVIYCEEKAVKGVVKASLGHPSVPMWRAPTLYGGYLSVVPSDSLQRAIVAELRQSFKVSF